MREQASGDEHASAPDGTITRARALLEENGVDSDALQPAQFAAFASSSDAVQNKSFNVYISNPQTRHDASVFDDHTNDEFNIAGQREDTVLGEAGDLLRRYQSLLNEVKEFIQHLKDARKEKGCNVNAFRNTILTDVKILEKALAKDPSSARTRQIVQCSNILFLEGAWAAAKRSSGLVRMRTRVLKNLYSTAEESPLADVITENGLEWIRILTVTERKLLFDMARQGWADSDLSDEEDEDEVAGLEQSNGKDYGELSIVRIAEDLVKASKKVHVKYKHPRVRLVFTRIEAGTASSGNIQTMLERIRAIGAIVQCADHIPSPYSPPLSEVMEELIVNEYRNFSSVLNLDCTILLALASDISHGKVERQPWFNKGIKRQIELESEEHLLPSLLYPAMGSHALVCTAKAAETMRHIVDTIGTPAEKARTAIIMGDNSKSRAQLIEDLRSLSDYVVPDNWQIPIQAIDEDAQGRWKKNSILLCRR